MSGRITRSRRPPRYYVERFGGNLPFIRICRAKVGKERYREIDIPLDIMHDLVDDLLDIMEVPAP